MPHSTRLYLDAALVAGASLALNADQAHFLRNVLRLQPGDAVAVFNGKDGEWLGVIDTLGKNAATLSVQEQRRIQDKTSDLWLLFAPIKKARIDFVAEKASELGVSVLWPVFTRRTNAERVNVDRLQANAIEAAEQCERLSVPEVREPVDLFKALQGWPYDRKLIVCAEVGSARPIADAVRELGDAPAAVLIGPEGGFAPEELDALRKLPYVIPVSLGPRVLRADTAALAALACWQALVGDWHTPRS